jgi:hypothetical protein
LQYYDFSACSSYSSADSSFDASMVLRLLLLPSYALLIVGVVL